MSILRVLRPGPMVSVQDRGRRGLLSMGVSASGPMDPQSFALANALVANDPDCAVLEFAGLGGLFELTAPARIAVTGGSVAITIDGRSVDPWEAHEVKAGEPIEIGMLTDATWGYLAISGGIAVEPVLGARATHLRTGIGGLQGRVLQPGDELPLGAGAHAPCLHLAKPFTRPEGPIRIVPGPQDYYFDEDAWNILLSATLSISSKRDRMAMALDGAIIPSHRGHDIVSDGIAFGSIQVPGSGVPYVLTAERQTTGGYPKIATVASCDLPRLVQMTTGTRFTMVTVTRDEAEELLIAERRRLRAILEGIAPKPDFRFDSSTLLMKNLISGVILAEAEAQEAC
jgi:biotin-dependent carboxylase-like uncharacterized protein